MESPISRTPSAIFSPGSHRRSHPNLHHLSLAPLTPKYLIDPADYSAYYDPDTSQLHTSSSLSNIATLPSASGILTNSPARSRASSRTRLKRKTKSHVTIQNSHEVPTRQRDGMKKDLRGDTDTSWLIQTGLALTEGSRESKGQLWIAKRDSSTALNSPEVRSGRTTPNRSRRTSRSRKTLAMTPAIDVNTVSTDYKPDWVDSQTQAEIAAETERDMEGELEGDEEDEDILNRYGMLDFEGQIDSQDEQDVREAVKKGWMDQVVDVFLKFEDEPDLEAQPPLRTSSEVGQGSKDSIEPPPEKPQGIWEDVRWFGRLVVRTVAS